MFDSIIYLIFFSNYHIWIIHAWWTSTRNKSLVFSSIQFFVQLKHIWLHASLMFIFNLVCLTWNGKIQSIYASFKMHWNDRGWTLCIFSGHLSHTSHIISHWSLVFLNHSYLDFLFRCCLFCVGRRIQWYHGTWRHLHLDQRDRKAFDRVLL